VRSLIAVDQPARAHRQRYPGAAAHLQALARWKYYEPELAPLFAQLEPYCT
jgi:hypothetical protein